MVCLSLLIRFIVHIAGVKSTSNEQNLPVSHYILWKCYVNRGSVLFKNHHLSVRMLLSNFNTQEEPGGVFNMSGSQQSFTFSVYSLNGKSCAGISSASAETGRMALKAAEAGK
ncbi:hypothetical protein GOODEAATRI_030431 [Goodea atripinnis]|uniref:Uncharacterized protein n=1 Tax=Goodea atripinnis TaxID=208336 RepID=A0ABV0PIG7_9TELE